MSLAQIEYFVRVAETGSVTEAAAQLFISQPPLSRQIQLLEAELGTELFARTRKGMTLLPAGQRFMVHARRILDAVGQARAEMSSPPTALPDHDAARDSESPGAIAPCLDIPRGGN